MAHVDATRDETTAPGRRRLRIAAALLVGIVTVGVAPPATGAADPGDVGEEGPPYVESTNATVSMSQSKAWFHDGSWFAAMLRTGPPSSGGSPDADVAVFRRAAGEWHPTSATIDTRATTKQDVIAVGDVVYVASHKKTDNETTVPRSDPDDWSRLAKLVYDPATGTYVMAPGFPVVMNAFTMEALTIDVDATGVLWAAWVQGPDVRWQRSVDGGATWSAPATLTVDHAAPSDDDIAAVVAFGDRVGVMWSAQTGADDGYWFTSTGAGAAAPAWSPTEAAHVGPGVGDDHISIKAVGGDLVAAIKTRAAAATDPGVLLLRRGPGGWTSTPVWASARGATRPIVVTDGTTVTVMATLPGGDGTLGIHQKSTNRDAPVFPTGPGTPAMARPVTGRINDVTSTKQLLTAESGTVAVASDTATRHYWTFTSGEPPSSVRPFPSIDAFTLRQAQDLLGRPPSDDERTAVRDALGVQGRSAASVLVGPLFLHHPDALGPELRTDPAVVARLYLAYFLRPPDTVGFDFWLGWLGAGRTVNEVSSQFAAAPEFTQRYGPLDDQGFVALVYRNVLEREPDPGGLAYWIGRLADGMSRGRVMTLFSELPENRTATGARVLVSVAHRWMLGRMPSKTEMLADAALGPEAAVARILLSDAYRARLGLDG